MATRSEIRSLIYAQISQVEGAANVDFQASDINGFIEEGIRFLAPLIKWPRKRDTITPVAGTQKYNLFSDAVLLVKAYFGDPILSGDVKGLKILTEDALSQLVPGWFEDVAATRDRPRFIILEDRTHVSVWPRPSAAESASGKLIHITYVYLPAALSSDSSTPDLPTTYHDLLIDYGKYKCYSGKLNNPQEADRLLASLLSRSKLIEPVVTKEFELQSMTWGNADSLDENETYGGITFA